MVWVSGIGRVGIGIGIVLLALSFPGAVVTTGHCADEGFCDSFAPYQVVLRMLIGYAPLWLMPLAWFGRRSGRLLVVVAIASLAVAVVTWLMGQPDRVILRPFGLSGITGFSLYVPGALLIGLSSVLSLAGMLGEASSRGAWSA